MGLTKAQLEALNDSSFPNNNAGAITPAILRDYNDAVILNTVNQDVYTTDSASFDSRIDGLATTSSVNAVSTSVGLLQTFSGSQYKADSASFSARIEAVTGSGGTVNTGSLLVTASFDNGTRNLTFTKGDATTFNVNIPDVSGSTGNFATTGSNSFVGDQTITGSVTISGSSTTDLTVVGQIFVSSSATGGTTAPRIIVSGSSGQTTILRNQINTNNGTNSAGLNSLAIFNSVIATSDEIGFLVDPIAGGVSGWTTGPAIYVNNDALDSYNTVFGFQNKANYTDGRVEVLTPLFVSQSLSVSGSATFSELTGSLGAFSASISNRINNVSGSGGSIDTGSFATTGSNTFTGNQTIEGAIISNPTTSLIRLFSQNFASGAVQYNITASALNAQNQVNLVFGGTILGAFTTGSVIISGSNNILHNPAKTLAGLRAFDRGYVNGNNNYLTVIPLLHTQSLFNPTVQANIGTGQLTMNFITSSIAVPFFINNNFSTTIQLNHQSGTIAMQNNISNGIITSNQNGLTSGTVAATINSNIVGGGGITLNHTSSSILTTTNTILGGTTVNNNYFHTGSNNSLTLAANLTNGQNITINAGGSPSTNVTRPIVANLLGGSVITIQADAVGTDSAGLRNEIVYGYNLIVSGAHSVANTTNQGGAFFGRYNDITNLLADSGKTIFAVGSGTSTGNRKTALSVDSASVVNVSGSLSVTGSSTFNGSLIVTGSSFSIDTNANVSGSSYYATANAGFLYAPSSASLDNSYTRYGKDGFQIYQYQGQPYAFGVICTADQLNSYTGSQFRWGTVNSLGPIVNYMNMISASFTGSIGGGGAIPGLDYLQNGEILQFQRDATFDKKVYIQQGLYVSQSMGGSTPALTINGSGVTTALLATGSCTITGSLNLNGQTTFASLESNTFTQTQIVSSSIYIAPNNNSNQLYLPSGSNKQTGIATLDGGNPGTVTVSNSNVTANSIILITKQTLAHPNGYVAVSSKGSGTFTITSNHNGDTDVVGYMIINAS
jgi:hypothetical protein